MFSLIVAINNESLIGVYEYGYHTIPWPLIKEDMNFFRTTTTKTTLESNQNAIIVGYNTWNSLPNLYRKNSKRFNIVVARNSESNIPSRNVAFVENFDAALEMAKTRLNIENIYVIGGSAIYHTALQHSQLDKIFLTKLDISYPKENIVDHKCYFPLSTHSIQDAVNLGIITEDTDADADADTDADTDADADTNTVKIKSDLTKNINFSIKQFKVTGNFSEFYAQQPKNSRIVTAATDTQNLIQLYSSQEQQYLELVKEIMTNGVSKQTRNGLTKSIFGYQMKFDLSKGYPISTVKKSYPKCIFEELIWIMRGQTDAKILEKKNVNIWKKNSTKEYLEKYQLPYEEGDIGPGYGFQMRHYGATYVDCSTDYTGQGVDQLDECINLIKNNPDSRRIIIDLWNCADVKKQALPSCHCMYNFGVDFDHDNSNSNSKGKLNCHLIQRSWDVLLGWNTTTAALLTYLLAHHCNLDPGILVHSITDAHLYVSHIESGAIDKLLARNPRQLPKLKFLTTKANITDYEFEDLMIDGYYPCPPIAAEMVA